MVTADAEVTTTPEAPASVADTELTQVPDAAPAPEIDAAESDVDAFLAGSKEGTEAQSPEGITAEAPELTEAREAAAAATAERVERETAARLEQERETQRAEEARQQQLVAFQQNYRTRLEEARAEAYESAIDRGYSEEEARAAGERAAQRFNSHHADGLKLYEADALRQVGSRLAQSFNDSVWEALETQADRDAFFKGEDGNPRQYKDPAEALKAYKEVVTRNMVTKSEATAQVKAGILAYRRKLEAEGLISSAESGSRVNGTPSSSSSFGSEHELNVAFNSGQIDRASYAREHKRITGREP